MKSFKLFLLLPLLNFSAFSAYASEIQLTIINEYPDLGVWVDKSYFPDCVPHPVEPGFCIIPPGNDVTIKIDVSSLPYFGYYRLIAMEAEGNQPELLSGAELSANPLVDTANLTCNTLGDGPGYNVKITMETPELFEVLCQEEERNIRSVNSADGVVTVEFAPSLE